MTDRVLIRSVSTAGYSCAGRRFTRDPVSVDLASTAPHIRSMLEQQLRAGVNIERAGTTVPAVAVPPVQANPTPGATATGGTAQTPDSAKRKAKKASKAPERDGG